MIDTAPAPAAQLSPEALAQVRIFQQNEVTESEVYRRIAAGTKDESNRAALLRIADEEAKHAAIWQRYTGEATKPQRGKVLRFSLIARVFGFTFAVKLMERGEEKAQISYEELAKEAPEALSIRADEESHEQALLAMLDEERLSYVGSMVLGMNDAMVEMTGTLAGLTLAMQNTRLIALSGLITGIAATLSMASRSRSAPMKAPRARRPSRTARRSLCSSACSAAAPAAPSRTLPSLRDTHHPLS